MASTQTMVYYVVQKVVDCFYEIRNMYDFFFKYIEPHCVRIYK